MPTQFERFFLLLLPEDAYRVPRDLGVGRDDGERSDQRLTDQHPVEGIPMQGREPNELERSIFVERQGGDATGSALGGHVAIRRLGQGQLAQSVLDGDLPG